MQTQLAGKANATHTHDASDVTAGQLGVAQGGTGTNLALAGGGFLKQATPGANVTVEALTAAEMPAGISAAKVGNGDVDDTKLFYLNSLTGNVQTQLNDLASGKADASHRHQSLSGPGGTPADMVVVDASGKVGVNNPSPKAQLDVGGGVRFGANAVACTADIVGTVRYNASTALLETCRSFDGANHSWNADVRRIDASVTLTVDAPTTPGDDCQLIQAKLNLLDGVFISRNAIVTISLPDGTYECSSSILVDHPQGHRIRILGSSAANVVLQFTDVNGIEVADSGLDLLNGMTLVGAGTATDNYGLVVRDRSKVSLGTDLIIDQFDDTGDICIYVVNHSSVQGDGTTTDYINLTNCTNAVTVVASSKT